MNDQLRPCTVRAGLTDWTANIPAPVTRDQLRHPTLRTELTVHSEHEVEPGRAEIPYDQVKRDKRDRPKHRKEERIAP